MNQLFRIIYQAIRIDGIHMSYNTFEMQRA